MFSPYRARDVSLSPSRILLILGGLQFFGYGWLLHLSADFAPVDNFAERPIRLIVGILVGLAILYLASLFLCWRTGDEGAGRRGLISIFGFAILFRLLMLAAHPIQEVDIYRYLWDGRVSQAGVNPYAFSPAEAGVAEASGDDERIRRLVRIRQESEVLAEIHRRVHFPEVRTVYPPASQVVFAGVALITPRDASLVVQVRVMKLVLVLFDLGAMGFLVLLLRDLGQPAVRAVAYAWCPLVLKEFANSGHLDSIAVCLLIGAAWAICRWLKKGEGTAVNWKSTWPSLVLWAGATLAKLFPVVLLPLVARAFWSRLGKRVWLPLAAYGLIVGGVFLGFSIGLPERAVSDGDVVVEQVRSPLDGLGTFARQWEMNDLLFMIVFENLRVREAGESPRFAVVPAGLRGSVAMVAPPFLIAQGVVAMILGTICLWLSTRRWEGDPRIRFLEGAFLSLAWLWYLSATQNPWYWTWALIFLPFARSKAWWLTSALALTYYLRFWFIYHPDEASFLGMTGAAGFDYGWIWLEQLPVLLWLWIESARRRISCRQKARPA